MRGRKQRKEKERILGTGEKRILEEKNIKKKKGEKKAKEIKQFPNPPFLISN